MRGDALVSRQRMMAQAVYALADHINQATAYQLTPVVYANLPSPAAAGMIAFVSDGVLGSGNVVTGGGTLPLQVFFDGANWIGTTGGGGGGTAGVTSWNTRTGAVTMTLADVTGTNVLNNTPLVGVPTAPTAPLATNTTQVATTAFVKAQGYLTAAITSVNGQAGPGITVAAGTGVNVVNTTNTVTISAPLFSSTVQGEVSASGGGTANFLRADGTWAAPPAGSGGVSSINTLSGALTIAAGTGVNVASAGTTITISAPLFGTSAQGEAPASGGGTANFLRADGTWAVPPSGLTAAVTSVNAMTGPAITVVAGAGIGVANASNQVTISGTLFSSSAQGEVAASGGGTANFLRADGTWATPPAAGGGFSTINVQMFTASGTYTPSSGMKYCVIECIGGGAGGGSTTSVAAGTDQGYGAGGGSGGYSRSVFSAATIGASQTVTIGTGGAGGVGGVGGNGGTTSVGSLITANGGAGGQFVNSTTQFRGGGAGAAPGTGQVAAAGAGGGGGCYAAGATQNITIANFGGSSVYGGGGVTPAPVVGSNVNGSAGRAYGSGGSGGVSITATSGAANGGAGSAGCVIVTEYF